MDPQEQDELHRCAICGVSKGDESNLAKDSLQTNATVPCGHQFCNSCVEGCSTAMKGVHESMEKLINKVDAYHKDLTEYLKQDQADKQQMRDDMAKMKKNQAEFANWMAKRVGQISQPQPIPFLAIKMKVPSSVNVAKKPATTETKKKSTASVNKKSSGASVAKQTKKRRTTNV